MNYEEGTIIDLTQAKCRVEDVHLKDLDSFAFAVDRQHIQKHLSILRDRDAVVCAKGKDFPSQVSYQTMIEV